MSNKKLYYARTFELMKVKYLLIGLGIGLFVAGLSTVIIMKLNKSQSMHNTLQYHPATFAVVEKFLCGCPKCEMELKTCYCTDGTGGVYEMYYISQRLEEGLTEDEVVKAVYKKFGKIKQEYHYLVDGGKSKPSMSTSGNNH